MIMKVVMIMNDNDKKEKKMTVRIRCAYDPLGDWLVRGRSK